MLNKRIAKEISDVMCKTNDTGISVYIVNNDMYHLVASVAGPKETPYENGTFKLDIQFPAEYPFKAPKIKFVTPVYHCNIAKNGDICLDILKDQWAPALTLSRLLLSVSALLSDPNPNDPLAPEVAELYRRNKTEHDNVARCHTLQYANAI